MKLREWLRRSERKRTEVALVPNRTDRRRAGFYTRRYDRRPLVATTGAQRRIGG